MDAELSVRLAHLDELLAAIQIGADIAIGSRELPGAQRLGEPAYRHLMGRAFNRVSAFAGVRGVPDTQCGFKALRAESTGIIVPRLRLYPAGYRVVRPVRDAAAMLWDIVRVRWHVANGHYR